VSRFLQSVRGKPRRIAIGAAMGGLLMFNVATSHGNVDRVIDRTNPFEVYQSRLLGVGHSRLAPPSFFLNSEGPVVGINGIAAGEPYQQAADYMTGSAFTDHPNVFQSRADSPRAMLQHLWDVRQKSGPIRRLVIAAHGVSGEMNIGGVPFSAEWVRNNPDAFATLPHDLFAPGAEVVLVSCNTASGQAGFGNSGMGVAAIKQMFTPFLRQGGTVTAATRYVDPRLEEIPSQYKTTGDRVMRIVSSPFGAIQGTIDWVFADSSTRWHKVVRIDIAPSP
jgi:hypothetical protein